MDRERSTRGSRFVKGFEDGLDVGFEPWQERGRLSDKVEVELVVDVDEDAPLVDDPVPRTSGWAARSSSVMRFAASPTMARAYRTASRVISSSSDARPAAVYVRTRAAWRRITNRAARSASVPLTTEPPVPGRAWRKGYRDGGRSRKQR